MALGGIIACGAVYAAIALAVMASGTRWIERLMPPVVTGSVVAVIGLNLASIPIKNMAPTEFDAWMRGRDLRRHRAGRASSRAAWCGAC